MVVMLMFSLFCVVCDGPGYLPRKWDNDGATGGSPTLASTPQLVTCPRPGQLLPCAPCEGYEAPRSEHCARCGRCVLRRGHHCAALNVCIGQYNQVDSGSYVYVILIFCKTTPEELLGAAGLQPRRQHPGRRHQLLGPELLPQVTPAPSPQPPDLLPQISEGDGPGGGAGVHPQDFSVEPGVLHEPGRGRGALHPDPPRQAGTRHITLVHDLDIISAYIQVKSIIYNITERESRQYKLIKEWKAFHNGR